MCPCQQPGLEHPQTLEMRVVPCKGTPPESKSVLAPQTAVETQLPLAPCVSGPAEP